MSPSSGAQGDHLSVRQATHADLDRIIRVEQESHNTRWERDDFEGAINSPGWLLLVAATTGEPVGHALARTVADEVEVLTIAVASNARRRGIGQALLAETLRVTGAQGAQQAFLEVRMTNTPARGLYRAAGFVETGRRARYYADGEDAILMSRALGSALSSGEADGR